ncbi:MAG: oligosaccharide flippase family protein [Gammaproteobacteria bacterium]|nr:oligosaccharide flippase family protein [Gammaproteobacteria bacterium]
MYITSGGLNGAIGFMLLPVLTRYLTAHEYGVLENFNILRMVLGVILLYGANTLLTMEYYGSDEQHRKVYCGNLLGTILFNVCVLFLIILLVFLFDQHILLAVKVTIGVVILASLCAFLNSVFTLQLTLLQIEKKAAKYAILINGNTLTNIVLSIILVVVFGLGWAGRVYGVIVALALFFFIAIYAFFRRGMLPKFNLSKQKTIFILGLPLMLSQVSSWITLSANKLLVNHFIGLSEMGVYAVATKFALIIFMLNTAFCQAWMPFFFENINKNKYNSNIAIMRGVYLYCVSLFCFTLLYAYIIKLLLPYIVGRDFYGAAPLILTLCLAHFFDGIWRMFNYFLIHKKRTRVYGGIVIAAGLVGFVASYWLLPVIGVSGAAWGVLISFAFGAAVTTGIVLKSEKMPWLKALKYNANRA